MTAEYRPFVGAVFHRNAIGDEVLTEFEPEGPYWVWAQYDARRAQEKPQ